ASLFAYLYSSLTADDFMSWGWRYPFCVAFAINVVALFARLRLVVGQSFVQMLQERDLEPISVTSLMRDEGRNVFIGAFAALASFALFHLVTVFPLSWISLYSHQSVIDVLIVQIIGAVLAAGAIMLSGWLADRVGRRNTLGTMACLIGIFSFLAPWLLGSGTVGNNVFIIVGFILLGLSYGQASGTVTSNFSAHYRYTGAALSTDMAWLIGAAFAPLVALGVSAKFGLVALGIYLLSGALCTLAALGINRAIEAREQ
ncbi:MAG: MFS transporter, partial [Comamonas sp.]